RRFSIGSANALTDADGRDASRAEARQQEIARGLRDGGFFSVPAKDLARLVADGLDAAPLVRRCAATDDPLLKAYRSAALVAANVKGAVHADRVEVAFASRAPSGPLKSAVKLDQIVWARSPVRF